MIVKKKTYVPPLLSLDLYLSHYHDFMRKLRVDNDLNEITHVLGSLLNSNLKNTIEQENYDALVITDAELKIVWVNDGFFEMTGYSKKFALGKKPNFLQGKETSEVTRRQIRNHLNKNEGFKTSILNYRRDGKTYLCQINAIPIYNKNMELVHYLAVEKELQAA